MPDYRYDANLVRYDTDTFDVLEAGVVTVTIGVPVGVDSFTYGIQFAPPNGLPIVQTDLVYTSVSVDGIAYDVPPDIEVFGQIPTQDGTDSTVVWGIGYEADATGTTAATTTEITIRMAGAPLAPVDMDLDLGTTGRGSAADAPYGIGATIDLTATALMSDIDPNAPTPGDDVISGTDDPDDIDALAGDDQVSGLAGNDTLAGGAGNDTLDGGTGADGMDGGTGDDTFRIDNRGDRVTEAAGGGSDTILATAEVTLGNAEIEAVILEGSTGLRVNGNGFATEITGNAGSNILIGGGGGDVVTGGDGADFFVFQASDADGPARITDFTHGQDRLAIDDQLFGLGDGSIDPRDVTDQQVANALQFRAFAYNQNTGELRVDADGSGGPATPILIAIIEGGGPLTQDDVLLF